MPERVALTICDAPSELPAGLRAILGNASFVLVCAITFLACAGDQQVTGITPPATITPPPYVQSGLTPAVVTRVVDGDTIYVEIAGTEHRLRYIGIDTPELANFGEPTECFGTEAHEYNRRLVEGQTVGLEKDVSETDEFGRLLRYVWLGNEMVNARLVGDGYASAVTYPPDVRYAEMLAALQGEAREAGRGLWAGCDAAVP
jgi:micrococcal nuclease